MPDRGTPSLSQVVSFLNFATDPQNQPVFVHCAAGVGRTGIFVAAYRIAVENATVESAIADAARFGMTRKSQQAWVRKFAAELTAMYPAYASRKRGGMLAKMLNPGEKLIQIYYRSVPTNEVNSARLLFEEQSKAGCEYKAKKAGEELAASSGGNSSLSGGACEFISTPSVTGDLGKTTLFCKCVAQVEKKQGLAARDVAGGAREA